MVWGLLALLLIFKAHQFQISFHFILSRCHIWFSTSMKASSPLDFHENYWREQHPFCIFHICNWTDSHQPMPSVFYLQQDIQLCFRSQCILFSDLLLRFNVPKFLLLSLRGLVLQILPIPWQLKKSSFMLIFSCLVPF